MARAVVEEELTLVVEDIRSARLREDCFKVRFITSRGTGRSILHHREHNSAAAILVGDSGGGLDGPAGIYRDMGPDLLSQRISSLRMDYRRRGYLEECVLDVLAGIEYLKDLGIGMVGLVGWSFGGAVVISAGALSPEVRAVAAIASQTAGAEMVAELAPKALLLIHGTRDRTNPSSCSQDLYRRAREPKELVLFDGANHSLDEAREPMIRKIEDFLVRHLKSD